MQGRVRKTSGKRFQLLFSIFIILFLSFILDTQKAFASCDRPDGVSSAFYKVKKVIIYLDLLQSISHEQQESFPKELKTENFKSLVKKIAEDNFSVCSSPVSMSGPVDSSRSGASEVYNPENLTIRIKLNYADALFKEIPESGAVSLDISFFRPGLEPANAFAVMGLSKSLIFLPNVKEARPFSEKLKNVLSGVLTPTVYGFNGKSL